jgi:hypothetical protein
MEDEAYDLAFLLTSISYPFFIVIGFGQILLVHLYMEKHHPFSQILEGANKPGMYVLKCRNKTEEIKIFLVTI